MNTSFSSILDNAFGVHAKALSFRSDRRQILASNLANADTPNYQARDIRFADVLNNAANPLSNSASSPTQTHEHHLELSGNSISSARDALYRVPYQPTLDGNTVEADVEQSHFARNAVEYQATLMMLSGRIKGIRSAITGGQ